MIKSKIILLTSGVVILASLTIATAGRKSTAHGAGKHIENMGEQIQETTQYFIRDLLPDAQRCSL
jgi:predicted small secreted protein